MTPFDSKNRLDNSAGIGQDNPNEAMNAQEQSKKSLWFLRKSGLTAILALVGIVTALTPV